MTLLSTVESYYCTDSICNTVENNDLAEDMWT